jgi:hypothetical protein
MSILATLTIHHPMDASVPMVINAADFTDAHKLWVEEVPAIDDVLRVAKGARGLWFVKRGDEALTSGFKTESEAEAAKAELA